MGLSSQWYASRYPPWWGADTQPWQKLGRSLAEAWQKLVRLVRPRALPPAYVKNIVFVPLGNSKSLYVGQGPYNPSTV